MTIFLPPNSGWQARWKLPCSRVRRRHSVSNNSISATSNGRSARNNTISLRLQRRKKPRNLRQRSPIKDTKMTIFDNYEVWFVIGSQHLYGPEALRQVTKHAEHVVNSLNAEAKLPCKLVLKPLGTTPDEITHICRDANYDDKCAGLVVWLHTFSRGKNVDQWPDHPQQTAAAVPYSVQRRAAVGQHRYGLYEPEPDRARRPRVRLHRRPYAPTAQRGHSATGRIKRPTSVSAAGCVRRSPNRIPVI